MHTTANRVSVLRVPETAHLLALRVQRVLLLCLGNGSYVWVADLNWQELATYVEQEESTAWCVVRIRKLDEWNERAV